MLVLQSFLLSGSGGILWIAMFFIYSSFFSYSLMKGNLLLIDVVK